jgi:hypothetical protein
MKFIIEGRTYNTERSTLVGVFHGTERGIACKVVRYDENNLAAVPDMEGDHVYTKEYTEFLFRTRKGEFFMAKTYATLMSPEEVREWIDTSSPDVEIFAADGLLQA